MRKNYILVSGSLFVLLIIALFTTNKYFNHNNDINHELIAKSEVTNDKQNSLLAEIQSMDKVKTQTERLELYKKRIVNRLPYALYGEGHSRVEAYQNLFDKLGYNIVVDDGLILELNNMGFGGSFLAFKIEHNFPFIIDEENIYDPSKEDVPTIVRVTGRSQEEPKMRVFLKDW